MAKDPNPFGFSGLFKFGGYYVDQRVTSTNQSGGITAHTVDNFAPPARHLTAQMKVDLLRMVPKDRLVKVDSPLNDAEAWGLAEEIWQFLRMSGYQTDAEHVQAVKIPPAPPGIGIDIETNPAEVSIAVGPRA